MNCWLVCHFAFVVKNGDVQMSKGMQDVQAHMEMCKATRSSEPKQAIGISSIRTCTLVQV